MGKVKIKRKSTLIDMTAMSDVTVLLLTFFMLTSTFLQKEPTIVYTPSSVSEEKVPVNNLVTVLVSSADKSGKLEDPNITEGKLFISFSGGEDSTLTGPKVRGMMLDEALAIYNNQHKNNPVTDITNADREVFMQTNMFGVPFRELHNMLSMSPSERDKFQGNLEDPRVGIPINGNKNRLANLNDFQVWLQAIYNVAQSIHNDKVAGLTDEERQAVSDLYTQLIRKGQGIAVKADKDTPYTTVEMVFDNLQTMKLNKFSLMTALKSEEEPTN